MGNKLVADVPRRIEGDAPRKTRFLVGIAHVAPEGLKPVNPPPVDSPEPTKRGDVNPPDIWRQAGPDTPQAGAGAQEAPVSRFVRGDMSAEKYCALLPECEETQPKLQREQPDPGDQGRIEVPGEFSDEPNSRQTQT